MIFLLLLGLMGWAYALALAVREFYFDKSKIERVERRNRWWWWFVNTADGPSIPSPSDGGALTADGNPIVAKERPNQLQVPQLMRRTVWPAVPFVIMACLVLGLLFMPAWALRTVLILWTIAVSVCVFLVMRLRDE